MRGSSAGEKAPSRYLSENDGYGLLKVARDRLTSMLTVVRWAFALVQVALLLVAMESRAQNAPKLDAPHAAIVITKLSSPIYPPLAAQVRIAGDVELALDIRPDGSISSMRVVSGHPLLMEAALDSAKQSQFECRNCGEEIKAYRLVYSFQLGPTSYCTETADKKPAIAEQPYPRLTQSPGQVTLIAQPIGTCDLAGTITTGRVRSMKCLYLWRCGVPKFVGIE